MTTAGTFYQFTGWTKNNGVGATTSTTTITAAAGLPANTPVLVSFSVSFELAVADNITIEVYQNGGKAGGASFISDSGSTAESHCIAGSITVLASAADAFTLQATCSASSVTPTWTASSFMLYSAY